MKTMFVITNYASGDTYRAKVVTPDGKSMPYHATCTAGGQPAAVAVVTKWYGEAAAKTIRPAVRADGVDQLRAAMAKPGRKQAYLDVFVFDMGKVS